VCGLQEKSVKVNEADYRALAKLAEEDGGISLKDTLHGIILTVTEHRLVPSPGQEPMRQLSLDDALKEAKLALLKEQTRKLHVYNLRVEKGLPAGVKNVLAQEQDTAQAPNWCNKCRVSLETEEEIQAHRANGCGPYLVVEPGLIR
jgi:hypothetical protein